MNDTLNAIAKSQGRKVAELPPSFTVAHLEIGPGEAMSLLGYKETEFDFLRMNVAEAVEVAPANGRNRPFSLSIAKDYALDMLQGDWHDNGESLTYDRRSRIVSGQHRLGAVLLAEKLRLKEISLRSKGRPGKLHFQVPKDPVRIPVLIVHGVSDKPEVVDSVDRGIVRKGSDVLFRRLDSSLGTKEHKALTRDIAAGAKLVWTRAGGKLVADRTKFPTPELIRFLDWHPHFVDVVSWVREIDRQSDGSISSLVATAQWAGMVYLFGTSGTDITSPEIDLGRMDEAKEFTKEFAEQANLPAGHPALVLRQVYTKQKDAGTRDRDAIVAAAVNAWNFRVSGRLEGLKPSDIAWKPSKEMPRCGGLDLDPSVIRELIDQMDADPEELGETPETPDSDKAKENPKAKRSRVRIARK